MKTTSYNELMKRYADRYYTRKNTDRIHVLVNHAAWSVLKGRPHDGAQVHIESYDETGERLLLTMTHGSVRLFNSRLKSVDKLDGDWEKSLADDGGFLVFNSEEIDKVAEAFGIKKKQQREALTSAQKDELVKRLTHSENDRKILP
ncbi:hypothetical protein BK026_06690 [Alteromonas sp. V450]|uniref:hypothetical protein n=1 Tax=Alteromonas sp. V450 TaxID=1912139 RepID=UPI0008FF41F0|nr:hypothetical protein [Alteromonas sp. V450]OJF68500.1 hypothetical protein BK026_06690 [Alteromonas sp. V450]